MWCYFVLVFVAIVLCFYAFFELHYFLRMCVCVMLARLVKSRCNVLDTTTIQGVCWTTDIDTLLYHMNNARYLRELDFARVDFYERTDLYRAITARGGSVYQGACTIRYRRFIRPFHRFIIQSRVTYWDDLSIFMEHRFVRPSDKFVHAIALCRQRVTNCSVEDVLSELLESKCQPVHKATPNTVRPAATNADLDRVESASSFYVKMKPPLSLDIAKWIEYNEISSANLRTES